MPVSVYSCGTKVAQSVFALPPGNVPDFPPDQGAGSAMPTDSANRNASCLYLSVYLRFGAVSLAIALSVHQNIIKILMYVESGQGQSVVIRGVTSAVQFMVVLATSSEA